MGTIVEVDPTDVGLVISEELTLGQRSEAPAAPSTVVALLSLDAERTISLTGTASTPEHTPIADVDDPDYPGLVTFTVSYTVVAEDPLIDLEAVGWPQKWRASWSGGATVTSPRGSDCNVWVLGRDFIPPA